MPRIPLFAASAPHRLVVAAATVCALASISPARGSQSPGPFRVGAVIPVGSAPHGIRFDPDGTTAFVALSGEGRIAVVDLMAGEVVATWEAGETPLDLFPVEDGWIVSQFRGSTLLRLDASGRPLPGPPWTVSEGPSLFSPASAHGDAWITAEFSDRLWVLDAATGAPRHALATGDRPYPADVMWDGSHAFVPNLDAGTVSVLDLLNRETDAEVEVCPGPPGGALTPDQTTYVVACGGSDELAFLNTASFRVTGRVPGVGPRPFSVAVADSGRHALAIGAGGARVSAVDLATRTVVQTLEAGAQPIVIRVHPDGERVFVATELAGTLVELVPTAPTPPAAPGNVRNEVVVMGMIHSGHETSESFSLGVVEALVRAIAPDVWLTEIPPNRWERARVEFETSGMVAEPRVRRFPEYMETLFPLSRTMDFEVVPTAGWTEPMADFRAAFFRNAAEDPAWAERWAEYQEASAASAAALAAGGAEDDPRWIHTDAYDEAYDLRMRVYARLFDGDLGPGGWDAINASHYAHIAKALDDRRGEGVRFLLTYGAGHKGPFLRELRKRDDIDLLDVAPFLDRLRPTPPNR